MAKKPASASRPAKAKVGSRFNFNKSQNDRCFAAMLKDLRRLLSQNKEFSPDNLRQLFDQHSLDVRHVDQRGDV